MKFEKYHNVNHYFTEPKDNRENIFISALMHEIKNYFTSIKGYLKLIDISLDEKDERRKYIYKSFFELDRMERLAKDVIMLVKSNNCNIQKVSLGEIIIDTFNIYRESMKERNIKYEFNFNNDVVILGDKNLLHLLFTNLLLNSIDAVKENGMLSVRLGKTEKRVIVEFEDNGEGIDESINQEQLFSPFFTTKENGTGMGLYISKLIVEKHGGNIYYKSQKGKGTVFYIEFPCCDC